MFRTILISAFGAGAVLCLALTALQFATTEPLILHAEQFEGAEPEAAAAPHEHAPGAAGHQHSEEEWAPADGLERSLYTALANLVVAVAASLMLLAAMTLKGDPIDARRGLLWGLGAFLAIALLPSLGLPPELPGTPAGDIFARQGWWLAAAVLSAIGVYLIAAGGSVLLGIAGLVFIALPHVVGAPVPPSHDVAYPGALAGEFVVASMLVSALLWIGSGFAAGWLHQRLQPSA